MNGRMHPCRKGFAFVVAVVNGLWQGFRFVICITTLTVIIVTRLGQNRVEDQRGEPRRTLFVRGRN